MIFTTASRANKKNGPSSAALAGRWKLETLEERTLLSISAVTTTSGSTETITFTGTELAAGKLVISNEDYLYLFQSGSNLYWSTDGASYSSLSFPAGTNIVVSNVEKVEIVGSIYTYGGSITMTVLNGVDIDDASNVLGSTGTLTSSSDTFSILGDDTSTNYVTLERTSGSAALTEGQLLTYSGIGSGTLYNASSYAVHIIDQTNPDNITVELYQPIVLSTSSSTGSAGAISLTATRDVAGGLSSIGALFSEDPAPTINVGQYDEVLAQGSTTSGNGEITFTTSDTITDTGVLAYDNLFGLNSGDYDAEIYVKTGAVVDGADVTMTSTAGDVSYLGSLSTEDSAAASGTESYFNAIFSLPISVLVKSATAKVEIENYASIISSGAVDLESEATPNSTGEAIYYEPTIGNFGASFAYDQANSKAEALVDDDVNITAASDVTIKATTSTTTSGTARVTENTGNTPTNPNTILVSAAGNYLTSQTEAIVGDGSDIDSGGNVSVSASAKDKDATSIQTASYHDGSVGLTFSIGVVNANVEAYVDGTVTATGTDDGTTETINPFESDNVDLAASEFVFSSAPGYATGEALTYSSGLGGAIPGLTSGTVYYAIVTSSNGTYYVQLADSKADAEAGTYITFGTYPTITTNDTDASFPITDVDASSNSYILFDFDPGFTEGEPVTITPQAGEALSSDSTTSAVFDADADVDLPNSAIEFTSNAGFQTGSAVFYDNGGGTTIGGLTDDQTYYVVLVPGNSLEIRLADSAINAAAGNYITFTAHRRRRPIVGLHLPGPPERYLLRPHCQQRRRQRRSIHHSALQRRTGIGGGHARPARRQPVSDHQHGPVHPHRFFRYGFEHAHAQRRRRRRLDADQRRNPHLPRRPGHERHRLDG